jgi:hypothetical protein
VKFFKLLKACNEKSLTTREEREGTKVLDNDDETDYDRVGTIVSHTFSSSLMLSVQTKWQ